MQFIIFERVLVTCFMFLNLNPSVTLNPYICSLVQFSWLSELMHLSCDPGGGGPMNKIMCNGVEILSVHDFRFCTPPQKKKHTHTHTHKKKVDLLHVTCLRSQIDAEMNSFPCQPFVGIFSFHD